MFFVFVFIKFSSWKLSSLYLLNSFLFFRHSFHFSFYVLVLLGTVKRKFSFVICFNRLFSTYHFSLSSFSQNCCKSCSFAISTWASIFRYHSFKNLMINICFGINFIFRVTTALLIFNFFWPIVYSKSTKTLVWKIVSLLLWRLKLVLRCLTNCLRISLLVQLIQLVLCLKYISLKWSSFGWH